MADADNPSPSNEGNAKRILIVDIDHDANEILKILLELEGYEVQTATNKAIAMDTAGAFRPNVILLYSGLIKNGDEEVIKNMREALPEIILIALLEWSDEQNLDHWKEKGFDHQFLKPVGFGKLLGYLREIK